MQENTVAKKVTPCDVINNLDFAPMIERIADPADTLTYSSGWPRDVAESIADQYRRFLWLHKKYSEKETLIPFREVDEFWHQHILHTKRYYDDCLAVFGKYLHHYPHKQKTEEDKAFYEKHYARTLALLEMEFPDVD